MKRYMVIYEADGEQGATFFDSFSEAENCRMNIECGLGGLAEVYERIEVREDVNGILTTVSHEYQFLYA